MANKKVKKLNLVSAWGRRRGRAKEKTKKGMRHRIK